jgi:hypothetical protein
MNLKVKEILRGAELQYLSVSTRARSNLSPYCLSPFYSHACYFRFRVYLSVLVST